MQIISGLPQVNCEESRVSIVFNTERPFSGRIFVKGMVDKDACRTNYPTNSGTSVVFEMRNGAACNMRRTRRVGEKNHLYPLSGAPLRRFVYVRRDNSFVAHFDSARDSPPLSAEQTRRDRVGGELFRGSLANVGDPMVSGSL